MRKTILILFLCSGLCFGDTLIMRDGSRHDGVLVGFVQIAGWRADLVEGSSAVGGGSAPGVSLPTWLVAVQKTGLSADALEARLRQLTPPIVARIERDRLVLDLRTVSPEQDGELPRLLARVG